MRDRTASIIGKEKWRLAAVITTVTITVLIIALSAILKAGESGRGAGNAICVYNGKRISALTNIEIPGQNPPPVEVQYGLSPEEIAERIEGVCKMGNLPGQELGELGSLPQENINVLIYLANETGDMEFYLLERNPYAGGMGQLKTSFITSKCLATRFIESMVKPGQEEIQTEALFKTDMPQPEEDEFIQAVERQIEDLLRQAEMQGEYEIQIGEYELFFENKACISAVVTGEQEYYVRYLIVRYGDDRYYFRPVGFGSDGSLEECEVGRHHMNQICAERTKLLNREKIKVNI